MKLKLYFEFLLIIIYVVEACVGTIEVGTECGMILQWSTWEKRIIVPYNALICELEGKW